MAKKKQTGKVAEPAGNRLKHTSESMFLYQYMNVYYDFEAISNHTSTNFAWGVHYSEKMKKNWQKKLTKKMSIFGTEKMKKNWQKKLIKKKIWYSGKDFLDVFAKKMKNF